MKAYMVTPIVFIALFLIAGMVFLNHMQLSAEQGKQVSSSLLAAKAGNNYWKKMLACTARAYETMKTEPVQDRVQMQDRISQRILEHDGIHANVRLQNVSGKTKVTITPVDYVESAPGLEFNYSLRNYSALLGIDYTFTG